MNADCDLSALEGPKRDLRNASAGSVAKQGAANRHREKLWGTLRPLERSEFQGPDRAFQALNDGLIRAWNTGNPVSWIVARVRCEFVKLSPHAYAVAHRELTQSTLSGLERHRALFSARFNPETIYRLVKGWTRLARGLETSDPENAKLIKEAKQQLLLVLTRRYGGSVYGVLARWRYEVGPSRFDTDTGYSYKTMWQRQKMGAMFDFGELLRIGRSLGFIAAGQQPPALWDNPRVQELETAWMHDAKKLGRPKEVSNLYKVVEAVGMRVDKHSLHDDPKIGLQSVVVDALWRFEQVAWDKVAPLFKELKRRGLVTANEFTRTRSSWCTAWNKRPVTCEQRLIAIRDERGLTNAQVAEALGLTKHSYSKPALPVFRALSYGERTKMAPLAVVAHLIGRTDDEVAELLDQKRREVLAQWRRQGSAISSEVAVERELWGVEYEDLPFDTKELQRLEWGKQTSLRSQDVVTAIQEQGQARVQRGLQRLLDKRELNTVSGAIANLVELKGLAPLARSLETSVPLLQNMIGGLEVPTLSKLRALLRGAGYEPAAPLYLDWRERYARHLIAENATDLKRVLKAYVAEHGTSRRALLKQKQGKPSEVARIFNWISDVGYVAPDELEKVLNSLHLSVEDPTRHFVEYVAVEGSISGALVSWIDSHEPEEQRKSIRDQLAEAVRQSEHAEREDLTSSLLRERIAAFEARHKTEHGSEGAYGVLQFLPGVTVVEIAQALTDTENTVGRQVSEQFNACKERGLSERDVVFALRDILSSTRRPLSLLEQALERGIPSAACPPGVLAYLASNTVEEAEVRLERLRSELREKLKQFDLANCATITEMSLWGVRRQDLDMTPKEFARGIWEVSGSEQDADVIGEKLLPPEETILNEIQVQARELGLKKAKTALAELRFRRSALQPSQLVEVAAYGISGKDRAFSEQGGFRIGAAAQFISGAVIPTPKQLKRILRIAELPRSREIECAWADSYARYLKKRETAPLGRVLLSQIAFKDFAAAGDRDTTTSRGTMDGVVSQFLACAGLSSITYRRVLHHACIGKVVKQEHLNALANALGYKPVSGFLARLSSLNGAQRMEEALLSWLHTIPRVKVALNQLEQVADSYVRRSNHLNERLSRGRESFKEIFLDLEQILQPHIAEDSGTAAAARREYVGVLPEELLWAYRRAHAELAEEDVTSTHTTELIGQPFEPWRKEPALFDAPIEERFDAIARRLLGGSAVVVQDLVELLPGYAKLFEKIQRYRAADTPWYVAAVAFYRDPQAALEELLNQLAAGREPKWRPKEFLTQHAAWVQSRDSLGKLNSPSMKLNFRAPIGDILASRRSGSRKR